MRSRRSLFILIPLLWISVPCSNAWSQELDKLLDLSMQELMDLKVVSVMKVPETINKVPATVRVITAEQIRANGYFTLEDALADLPGFQFRNIEGFNTYTFLRGVPSQNNTILLLVDGIQINELNSGGFYGGGQFNLASVERIEVVVGPASALYGTNALSGIINIITRDPRNGNGGVARVSAGNFATRLADFRYGAYDEGRDLGFTLSGMYKSSDKADLKGRAGDYNWTGAMKNFEDDLSFDGKFRFKDLTAGFVFQDKDASRATVQQAQGTGLSDHGVNWHIRFLNTWAAYTYDRAARWSFRSTAYYRDSTVLDDTVPVIELETMDSPGRQYRYFRPNHLLGNESQFNWTPGARWQVALGLVLERESLADGYSITTSDAADERPPKPPMPDMTTNSLVSFYAQGKTALSGELNLFVGVRHDDSTYYGTVDTPRLGLVFNRGKLTAKTLYMEAFRAPKPWDYTDGLGNPDLKPEKMHSVEAAGAWSFSESLRMELSVYRNRLDNLLSRADEAGGWRWVNSGILDTKGCEAALEYRWGAWNAYLNSSYADSTDPQGRQVPEISRLTANAGVRYAFSPGVTAGLRGNYLGERDNTKVIPSTGNDRIGDAFILHATASFRFPKGFELQVAVDNLLDTVYYHPSGLPPSRYRQPQRTFRLQGGFAF